MWPLRNGTELGGRKVVGHVRVFLALQIHRHTEHHRDAPRAGDVKGLAHVIEQAVDGLDGNEVRTGAAREWRHIDFL